VYVNVLSRPSFPCSGLIKKHIVKKGCSTSGGISLSFTSYILGRAIVVLGLFRRLGLAHRYIDNVNSL
jgi:hypothetical protein